MHKKILDWLYWKVWWVITHPFPSAEDKRLRDFREVPVKNPGRGRSAVPRDGRLPPSSGSSKSPPLSKGKGSFKVSAKVYRSNRGLPKDNPEAWEDLGVIAGPGKENLR